MLYLDILSREYPGFVDVINTTKVLFSLLVIIPFILFLYIVYLYSVVRSPSSLDMSDDDQKVAGTRAGNLKVDRPLQCNGVVPVNGYRRVVCAEMCCFCFDTLIHYLHQIPLPRAPRFTTKE